MSARVGNLIETMNRLGHSTPKASLVYQQMVNGRDVEIANQLSALATSVSHVLRYHYVSAKTTRSSRHDQSSS